MALPCGADCRTVREENPSRGNLPVRLVLVDVSLRGGDGFVGMAGIKQNGILGQLLRDSWLASAEHLV